MNALQAAARFPFVTADQSKAWAHSNWPSLTTVLEGYRKNVVALSNANQVAFEGLTTLVQRQGNLLGTTADECNRAISGGVAAASFEERATRQADAARCIYHATIAGFRESYDIATKANVEAADILNARLAEGLGELKGLFASPVEPVSVEAASVEPTQATAPEPRPVVAEPLATSEEAAPVGVGSTVREPTPKKAFPTAALGAKPNRRPGSRG